MNTLFHTLTEALGPEPKDDLLSLFRPHDFPKNTSLLRQGELWNQVLFVERGMVRLYFVTTQGQEYNKNFFTENMLVWPATPLTRKEESLFYIGTLEESRIHIAPFKPFEEWVKTHGLWEKFTLPFCERLVDQKISREYAFLMSDAQTRYQEFVRLHPDLARRIPDYHLASYLGMSNVTLSRIKNQP